MKFALIVEYDGSRYHGFEWQAGVPTIQAELEGAIEKVTGEKRRVIAASRTDAGVHARGQVVSFWTESRLPADTMRRALDHHLPPDIGIQQACLIRQEFSVRGDAVSREYRYRIVNRTARSPLARRWCHQVIRPLDVGGMDRASRLFLGEHDLLSFATSWEGDRSPIRRVYEAGVERDGEMVVFRIVADAFLPHQVRNTAGLLIRLGLGKMDEAEFKRIMEARRPGAAGPSAPAHGLCLVKVNYREPLGE